MSDFTAALEEARHYMEVKVWRDGEGDPREEGLAQLERYLHGLGVATGWSRNQVSLLTPTCQCQPWD